MIQDHVTCTNSEKGKEILNNFGEYLPKFKKIIPHDYSRMLQTIVQMEEKGLSSKQAQIEHFMPIPEDRREKKMGKPTGFLDYKRKTSDAEAPEERIKHFNEFHVHLPLEEQQLQGPGAWPAGCLSASRE